MFLKKRKNIEQHIQEEIVKFLKSRELLFCHIPNEFTPRDITQHFTRYRMGVVAGVPDLCIFLPEGKTLWVEVKSPTGTLSVNQIKFHSMLEELNHSVYTVRNIFEFKSIINKYVK